MACSRSHTSRRQKPDLSLIFGSMPMSSLTVPTASLQDSNASHAPKQCMIHDQPRGRDTAIGSDKCIHV